MMHCTNFLCQVVEIVQPAREAEVHPNRHDCIKHMHRVMFFLSLSLSLSLFKIAHVPHAAMGPLHVKKRMKIEPKQFSEF